MSGSAKTDLMMDEMLSRIMEDVEKRYPAPIPETEEPTEPEPPPPLRQEDAVDAIGWDGEGRFILADSFPRTLARMLGEKGLTGPKVYKKIDFDRKLFSKLASIAGIKVPTKGEVMAFAIGMGLSLVEAKELMASAGFAFSRSNKVDCIIEYFISKGEYDIRKVDAALWDQAGTTLHAVFSRSKKE